MNVPKWAVFLAGILVGIMVGAEVYHLTLGGAGRYQWVPSEAFVLDTKTGTVKYMSELSQGLPFDKVNANGLPLTPATRSSQ